MEKELQASICRFLEKIRLLEQKRNGSELSLTLSVSGRGRWDDQATPPKISLEARFYNGKTYQTVEGSSLERVFQEVLRRAGFEDREAIFIDDLQKSFAALPAPAEDSRPEPLEKPETSTLQEAIKYISEQD